ILEGIGMIVEVDLHAADVDVANALRTLSCHFFDRGGLARQIPPAPLGIIRPRPGNHFLLLLVPMSALGKRDGSQKPLWKTVLLLRRAHRFGAGIGKFRGLRDDAADSERRDAKDTKG